MRLIPQQRSTQRLRVRVQCMKSIGHALRQEGEAEYQNESYL